MLTNVKASWHDSSSLQRPCSASITLCFASHVSQCLMEEMLSVTGTTFRDFTSQLMHCLHHSKAMSWPSSMIINVYIAFCPDPIVKILPRITITIIMLKQHNVKPLQKRQCCKHVGLSKDSLMYIMHIKCVDLLKLQVVCVVHKDKKVLLCSFKTAALELVTSCPQWQVIMVIEKAI